MLEVLWLVLALLVFAGSVWRLLAGNRARRLAHERFRRQGYRLVDKATPVRFVASGAEKLAIVGEPGKEGKVYRVNEGGWEPLERKEAA